jgi:hypothetical protein
MSSYTIIENFLNKEDLFNLNEVILKNAKTAVFYCDTNNGFTKLINGDVIKSIENKILIFDAEIMHTGTTCTDKPRRTVINFNYIEDEKN